jgi:hypothetical protein
MKVRVAASSLLAPMTIAVDGQDVLRMVITINSEPEFTGLNPSRALTSRRRLPHAAVVRGSRGRPTGVGAMRHLKRFEVSNATGGSGLAGAVVGPADPGRGRRASEVADPLHPSAGERRRRKQLAITITRRHVMKYLLLPFSPSRP